MSLLHGDCLDLLPTVADGSVDMVFADLPYAHMSDGKVRKCTANAWDRPIDLDALWAELLRVGKRNAAFVFTATFDFAVALRNSQPKLGLRDFVWRKGKATGVLHAKKAPLRIHETGLVFYRSAPVYNPQMWDAGKPRHGRGGYAGHVSSAYGQNMTSSRFSNDRYPLSVIDIRDREEGMHPTQKPVALLEWLIRTYSNPGDTVLDPTMGSGTTGCACISTGRSFIGMEKDATYYATAQRRLAEGQPPLIAVS